MMRNTSAALQMLFFKEMLLRQTITSIANYLQEPVLIHSDENNSKEQVGQVVRGLNSVVIISTAENRPSPDFLMRAQSAVVLGHDPEILFSSLRGYRPWNGRIRVVVLVDKVEDVEKWLSTAWEVTRVANITAIVMSDPIRFYTWRPYTQPDCSKVTPVAIRQADIFARELKTNMEGCTIYFVMSPLIPLVFNETHGLEPRIAYTIAKKLNITLEYTKLPGREIVWAHVKDGKPISGMKKLWENKADLMFSHQYIIYERTLFAEMTSVFLQDHWKWYVPGPLPISRAIAIAKAFPTEMWWYVAGICGFLIIFNGWLHHLEDDHPVNSFLRVFALVLNLGASLPPSNTLTVLHFMTYLYSLHIVTAYQSSLLLFLSTIPREKRIKTIEDLADSTWPLHFHNAHESWLKSIDNPYLHKLIKPERAIYVHRLTLVTVYERLAALLGPGTSYDYTKALNAGGVFTDENMYPTVLGLKKPLSTIQLTMYMSPGHPLLLLFRRYTQYLFEGGFPEVFRTMDGPPIFPSKVLNTKRSFSVENVLGAFYVLAVMLSFSLCIFFIEILNYKCENIIKKIDIL